MKVTIITRKYINQKQRFVAMKGISRGPMSTGKNVSLGRLDSLEWRWDFGELTLMRAVLRLKVEMGGWLQVWGKMEAGHVRVWMNVSVTFGR